MEKNYENNLTKEQTKKLTEKYKEVLEKYGISLEQCQTCQFTEFLAKQHPERYDNHMYRSSKELQEICAVISKEKNIAVMINLNEDEKSKIPEGEFGVYDLQKHKFQVSEQIKGKIRQQVEKMSNGTLTAKEEDEMVEELSPKNLDDMEKIATVDMEIEIKTKKAVDKKIDEKNAENGKTKEEREAAEKDSKEQAENSVGEKDGQDSEIKKMPEDVVKACMKLGITEVKAFMYAKGQDFADKTDIPYVNPNAGNVLIIRAADHSKGTDKYYVFQGDRLCVPGNRDEEIDQVARKSTQYYKNGTLVKPLEIDDEEQFVEFTDTEGMVVKEKIEESMDLSVKELEAYKQELEQALKDFSEELYKIENTEFLDDAQKDALYIQANEKFNTKNEELAKRYGIDLSDVKSINLQTDERTEEKVEEVQEERQDDEPDAFEVPGKREH